MTLPGGGRADVVALDGDARVVVVEIKRDVERGQLAQCLEYAGWARTTNLDELSGMYHRGEPSLFFSDWQEFTESTTPTLINRNPRLVLVARSFHERTESALRYLIENGLPVTLVPVTLYEDQQGRRFLDIEAEHEPEFAPVADAPTRLADLSTFEGKRIRIADLLDAELVRPGEQLVWERPRLGVTYAATITSNGALELSDGRRFASPSRAAVEAARVPSMDGWLAWKVPRINNALLNDLRIQLVQARAAPPAAD